MHEGQSAAVSPATRRYPAGDERTENAPEAGTDDDAADDARGADGRKSPRVQQMTHQRLQDEAPSVDAILARPECAWIGSDLEQAAQACAAAAVVPEHLAEVRTARLALIEKTEAAVKDRLTKEISGEARRRADTMQTRLADLKRDAQISPRMPVVLGPCWSSPAINPR